jgi:uncharacterized protein (DUF362 family)
MNQDGAVAENSSDTADPKPVERRPPALSRRDLLIGAGAVTTAVLAARLWPEGSSKAPCFIAKAESYEKDLRRIVEAGLTELGMNREEIRGKRIVLKPNLVEPTSTAPHINTHPLFVRAIVEVFRGMDAASVTVAEGQGHVRDSLWVLDQSGLGPVLDKEKIPFVDLNHDDVVAVKNALGRTKLKELHLPRTIVDADLVVSLPKLKTHHWAGCTVSMKNLFGVMPGIIYGWPKNVLHQHGIDNSIADIHATVRPGLAIVDGIIGMEGDGPIMGTAKNSGVIIMGRNLVATDATSARVMTLNPKRIGYLELTPAKYGPVREPSIEQRGETIRAVATRFELLDHPLMDRFLDNPPKRPG